jgi:hypothetical protein
MSWETQGRQYHQWFGHGTAGATSPSGAAKPEALAAYYTNPNAACRALGMDRFKFKENLHKLKDAHNLSGNDNVIIHVPSGDVFFGEEYVGNVCDG